MGNPRVRPFPLSRGRRREFNSARGRLTLLWSFRFVSGPLGSLPIVLTPGVGAPLDAGALVEGVGSCRSASESLKCRTWAAVWTLTKAIGGVGQPAEVGRGVPDLERFEADTTLRRFGVDREAIFKAPQ